MKSHGFLVIYDRCTANSIIKYNKLTISWYADDIKVSSIDEEADKKVI